MKDIHVLIVEDNEGDIMLLREVLEDRPKIRKISVVKNGQDAIDFVVKSSGFTEEETPDLILLDINLPLKNGHEVLESIKTHEEYRFIPIVMLTTSSSPEDINQSYYQHANLYITKPSDMHSFEEVLKSIDPFLTKLIKLPS
ncbi:response regulator [Algoriphagus sp.]|uniref:response regulator n=1 Tax=Algoriphagus sp. TaxID=1872435 RepID=UPI00391D9F25